MSSWKPRLWEAADRAGISRAAEWLIGQRGWCILWVHGICPDHVQPLEHYSRDVPLSVFRAQMKHMREEGFEFISLSEGLQRMRNGQPLDGLATLTFDDGFQSVVELAYPVMIEYDLKGTFYVVSGCIGTGEILWTDRVDLVCQHQPAHELMLEFPDGIACYPLRNEVERLQSGKSIKRRLRTLPNSTREQCLQQIDRVFAEVPRERIGAHYRFASWEELISLDPAVLDVGNHTLTHPNLANVMESDVLSREIVNSKRLIEERLNRPVFHFCYPAGSYNETVLRAVAQAGHISGTTIQYGTNDATTPRLELRRLGLPSTLAHFRARVGGLERALLKLRAA